MMATATKAPRADKAPKKSRTARPEPETAPAAEPSTATGAGAGAGSAPPPVAEPAADLPPAPPQKRRRAPRKATTRAIEDALAEILTMPALPCALIGDEWAADHFTIKGRELAATIAKVSERNPVLRKWCERAMQGESTAVLLMASIMYAYPPLLHWGVLPGPAGIFGVPLQATAPEAHMPDWETGAASEFDAAVPPMGATLG